MWLGKKLSERGVFRDNFKLTQLVTKLGRRRNSGAAWEILHCVMELGGEVEVAFCNGREEEEDNGMRFG